MSTVPGLFVGGEANFSDHGANRLGASALMQGLADGYFVLPAVVSSYIGELRPSPVSTDHPSFREAENEATLKIKRLMDSSGERTVDSFHRELGRIMWEYCGMARNDAGLRRALELIPALRAEFWENVRVPGGEGEINQQLEKAGRVADFLELGELIVLDALHREESCGGHFREEHQTEEGEAKRDDENFAYVAAWKYQPGGKPTLLKEPLTYENVHLAERSYK
jgi:succinate dehydrogenase / fumarate reductase flavoprotein subunit